MKKRYHQRRKFGKGSVPKKRKPTESKTYNEIVARVSRKARGPVNINEALFREGKSLGEARKIFAQICRELKLEEAPGKKLRFFDGLVIGYKKYLESQRKKK